MSGNPQWYGVKRDPDLAEDGELQGGPGAGAVARPEPSTTGGPAAGPFHGQAHGPPLALSAQSQHGQQRHQRPGPARQQEHQATTAPRQRSTAHHQPMQLQQQLPPQHQQQLHQQQLIHPPFALVTPPADSTTPSHTHQQQHLQYFQHHQHHQQQQVVHRQHQPPQQQQHPPQQQQQQQHDPSQTAISENPPPPGPGASLRHPHDPRLVQPHQQQHVRPPGYFPPDAADFPPQSHIDNHQYFPTPLDHPDHVQQQFYQQLPNWPLPDGLWSPLMHPDLSSILNAESYHDGTSGFPAHRAEMESSAGVAPSRQPLKRTTDQANIAIQEQAEPPVKRPRGRPKLIVDDTEAGHRRRGQIREAQRAYRGRNQDLLVWNQRRVKEMRVEKEQMSNAFMELHDFIVNQGLLHLHQDLPQQLQTAANKFVELAKEPDDEPVPLKPPRSRKPRVAAAAAAAASAENAWSEGPSVSPQRGAGQQRAGSNSPDAVDSAPKVLFAGLIVSHEPDGDNDGAQASSHAGNWSQGGPSPSALTPNHNPSPYEVVSQPTAHNASFPYGMSLEAALETNPLSVDNFFTTPAFTPMPPDMLPSSAPSWGASLPPSLAGPSSLSYQERTFGRRLQRAALEQGIRLFNMPNPPPHFFAAVFGFCLLFETRETIIQRLTDRLSVNQQESMNNWRAPFLHLGGAGTFFNELNEMDDPLLARNVQDGVIDPGQSTFQQQIPPPAVGNRGLAQPHRSKVAPDSMYGQGPWPAATESARDLRVDRKLRIVMPGWEGDFYDCDEIEWYLQQRGVVIPPAADVVTAEIDENAFVRGENPGPVKAFDATIDNFITDWLTKDYVQDGPGAAVAAQLATPSATGTRSHGTPLGEFDLAHAEAVVSAHDKEDVGPPWDMPSAGPAAPGKRRVTVNVEVLVNEQFVWDGRLAFGRRM